MCVYLFDVIQDSDYTTATRNLERHQNI